MFTNDELCAIVDLIEFHDDWDAVSERVSTNVEELYDKVIEILYNNND